MGLGPLELGAALFGKTTTSPKYGTEYGAGAVNEWIKRLSDFNATTRPAAIAKYSSNLDASTGENQAVSSELSAFYRDIMGKAGTYDPFTTSVRPAADYAFTKLGELSQNIPSLTRRANNQNAINLGLSPGARSSAVDRAQFSNMAQLQQNSLASLLPWITQSAQLDDAARRDQFLRAISASEALKMEPDRLAGRALLPMNVEAAGYTQDIPNLAALIATANANIQGWESKDNTWARLGAAEADEKAQIQSMVGQAMQAVASIYGGGAGGAIGGMFGGGGTGGTATPTAVANPTGLQLRQQNPYAFWQQPRTV